ncbi:unnamed protein product, partial [Prorocentrum cordatum]
TPRKMRENMGSGGEDGNPENMGKEGESWDLCLFIGVSLGPYTLGTRRRSGTPTGAWCTWPPSPACSRWRSTCSSTASCSGCLPRTQRSPATSTRPSRSSSPWCWAWSPTRQTAGAGSWWPRTWGTSARSRPTTSRRSGSSQHRRRGAEPPLRVRQAAAEREDRDRGEHRGRHGGEALLLRGPTTSGSPASRRASGAASRTTPRRAQAAAGPSGPRPCRSPRRRRRPASGELRRSRRRGVSGPLAGPFPEEPARAQGVRDGSGAAGAGPAGARALLGARGRRAARRGHGCLGSALDPPGAPPAPPWARPAFQGGGGGTWELPSRRPQCTGWPGSARAGRRSGSARLTASPRAGQVLRLARLRNKPGGLHGCAVCARGGACWAAGPSH